MTVAVGVISPKSGRTMSAALPLGRGRMLFLFGFSDGRSAFSNVIGEDGVGFGGGVTGIPSTMSA